ncbi:MAG: 4Fe-4S binding protein [Planctomycetaceae bacterium]|nr:4Fe-4S binding protein [Planctomycetaceae bacterium]
MTVVIDSEKCVACGECVLSCPLDAITQNPEQDNKAEVDTDICGECGACFRVCPVGAIYISDE